MKKLKLKEILNNVLYVIVMQNLGHFEQCPLCHSDAESGTLIGCTACRAKHHADCVSELSSNDSCGACNANLERVVAKASESVAYSTPRTRSIFSFKEKLLAFTGLAAVWGLLYMGWQGNSKFKANNPSTPSIRQVYDRIGDKENPLVFNHSYNGSAPFEVKISRLVSNELVGDDTFPDLWIDFNLNGDSGFIRDGKLNGLVDELFDTLHHKSFPLWTFLNSLTDFEKYTMQTFYKGIIEAANAQLDEQEVKVSRSQEEKIKMIYRVAEKYDLVVDYKTANGDVEVTFNSGLAETDDDIFVGFRQNGKLFCLTDFGMNGLDSADIVCEDNLKEVPFYNLSPSKQAEFKNHYNQAIDTAYDKLIKNQE